MSNEKSFLNLFEPCLIKRITKEPNLFYGLKQHSRCVLKKRYSEYMQQIYRRTPMPKYDFNKIALRCKSSPVNLLCTFKTPFLKKPLEGCFFIFNQIKSYHMFSPNFNQITNGLFLKLFFRRTFAVKPLTNRTIFPAKNITKTIKWAYTDCKKNMFRRTSEKVQI